MLKEAIYEKKIILIILLLLIIVSASATYAYIVSESATETVITFGSLKMKLHYYTREGNSEIEIKEDKDLNISSVDSLRLENIGNHPMYVRVNFDIKNDDNVDLANIIRNESLDDWIYSGGYYYYYYYYYYFAYYDCYSVI